MQVDLVRPRTDDRPLWDVCFGLYGYAAILIAHRLRIFEHLAEKPLSLTEVGEAVGIEPRPTEVLLTAATSVGLLRLDEGRYALTPVSEDYLLETSPTPFGFMLTEASERIASTLVVRSISPPVEHGGCRP